jgi:hypothetical protein
MDWRPLGKAVVAGAIAGVVGGAVAGTIVDIYKGGGIGSFLVPIALGNLASGAISAGLRDIFRQYKWIS